MIKRSAELSFPTTIDFIIVVGQLMNEYTLNDSNGDVVPNSTWTNEETDNQNSYPDLPFQIVNEGINFESQIKSRLGNGMNLYYFLSLFLFRSLSKPVFLIKAVRLNFIDIGLMIRHIFPLRKDTKTILIDLLITLNGVETSIELKFFEDGMNGNE